MLIKKKVSKVSVYDACEGKRDVGHDSHCIILLKKVFELCLIFISGGWFIKVVGGWWIVEKYEFSVYCMVYLISESKCGKHIGAVYFCCLQN